ncbi:hypothetical protein QO002_005212 [Pararhizobium capsulatum DSM 1112]|uniref:Uncharacterized protein n=1 Tax=Pararhizobium capsulatum DSM 1112 TaxID=1121113 RepID=A0ABU0BXK9_9HYPH|nr:hypothetical protein [Pararhizobium capsulatum DSM 1112]
MLLLFDSLSGRNYTTMPQPFVTFYENHIDFLNIGFYYINWIVGSIPFKARDLQMLILPSQFSSHLTRFLADSLLS